MAKRTVGYGLLTFLLSLSPLLSAAESPSRAVETLLNAAEEDWKERRWQAGFTKLQQIVDRYPNDSGAAEAHFRVGWFLSYRSSPDSAVSEYQKAIRNAPLSHAAFESRIGIASLHHWLGQYQQAYDLFREVVRTSKDWSLVKESTFRMKEIGRMMGLQSLPYQRSGLDDCGPRALEGLLKGHQVALSEEEAFRPASTGGATLQQLKSAVEAAGLQAWAARLEPRHLESVPKPFIAHLRNNHYVLVTGVGPGRIEYVDPHRGKEYSTPGRFGNLWRGVSLLAGSEIPSQTDYELLPPAEMAQIRGGHHLHGMNLGGPEDNPPSEFEEPPACQSQGPGLPRLSVNLSNFNLLVRDTVFSYSGRGPRVSLQLTYNADSPEESVFGRSWTFNYDVHLEEDPNGNVEIKRGSGKIDLFAARGDGTFSPQQWSHDELDRNADGTFSLRLKESRLIQRFDVQGRLDQVLDANGNAVRLQYDAGGRLAAVTDAVGRVTQFQYGPNGKVARVVDPIQRESTFTYDESSNLVGNVDMAGNQIQYTYNEMSYMSAVTTPQGSWQIINGTTPHFNEFPFVVKSIRDPLGNAVSFDTDCCIAWVDDARGNRTFYFNNANAETTEITDPLGNKTFLNYSRGNVTRLTDSKGERTSLQYDQRGNLIAIVDQFGNRLEASYDALNDLQRFMISQNTTYEYEYDSKGNVIKIIDPAGGTTRASYDEFGQLVTLQEPLGNTITFSYDNMGHLISTTTPTSDTSTFQYDAVGRLIRRSDPNDNTFSYSYDAIDRVTEIQSSDGQSRLYSYDCCNLISITDSSQVLSFEHDSNSRLVHFDSSQKYTIRYAYDSTGNLATLTYPDGKQVLYEYDPANRLQAVIDWLGQETHYTYDTNGNVAAIINGNQTVVGYQYDSGSRLVGLINARGDGTLISSHRYGLDRFGNRIKSQSHMPSLSPLDPDVASFEYDADNRLVMEDGIAYEYDKNGNLTKKQSPGSETEYIWNHNNQLIRIREFGITRDFRYDLLGNRISEKSLSLDKSYQISPRRLETKLLVETTEDGIIAHYVYGLGLVSRISDDAVYYFHYDGTGNTVALTDSAGNVVNYYDYEPFGELSTAVEGIPNPFRYVGQFGVMASMNSLVYMRARYYDTRLRRFISKDPLGLEAGLNLYAYVLNNPLNLVDPTGLGGVDECSYYDEIWRSPSCGADQYACNAGECCRDFGESSAANCVRECLISRDKGECAELPAPQRSGCRTRAHYSCYAKCFFLPIGIPASCWKLF